MDINLDKTIGETIALERKIANQSRKDLGGKIGVTYQQIKNYEKGQNQLSIGRLFAISKALKLPLSQLIPDNILGKKLKR